MARSHSHLPRGLAGARVAALALGVSLGIACAIGPAAADKVGVAAAVNPDAFSSLTGVPKTQLNIGKSIFYNERIATTDSGLVQVLLVDGSTFTVGPNSDLVIDKFVYDPRKKTGEMVATFSKGTMRFIGGKLSKNEGGVVVKTPSGALAIRGGIFWGSTYRHLYSFMFGDSLTLTDRTGHSHVIFQQGWSFDLSNGGVNSRQTRPEDINAFMQALSSPGTNFGSGDPAANPANPNGAQEASNLNQNANQLINDANIIQVQTAIQQQLANLDNLPNSPSQNNPGTESVVKDGGEFNGFASGFAQTGNNGMGEPDFVYGTSHVVLDPDGNSVTANIDVHRTQFVGFSVILKDYNLGYSGVGNGAYINDDEFLALGDDGTTTVVHTSSELNDVKFNDVTYLPPQGDNPPSSFASLNTALCSGDCGKILKYGFWGADISYAKQTEYGPVTEKMGGWWVATNAPVDPSDVTFRGEAYYEGLAVGTLAERNGADNSESQIWKQRPASGDLSMSWNFAQRRGDLKIEDFGGPDGKNFGGPMYATNQGFRGELTGTDHAKGIASGAFVGPNGANAPKGVMGNFGVGNNNWKANGVFGGGLVNPNAIAGAR